MQNNILNPFLIHILKYISIFQRTLEHLTLIIPFLLETLIISSVLRMILTSQFRDYHHTISILGLPSEIISHLVWGTFGSWVKCWWQTQDLCFVLFYFFPISVSRSSSCQAESAGHFNSQLTPISFILLNSYCCF